MKVVFQFSFLFLVALNFSMNSNVMARDLMPIEECAVPVDKIPWPYSTANRKYDLAVGEFYALKGRAVTDGNIDYFEIDLGAQPWLATEKRKQNPLILLDPTHSAHYEKSRGATVLAMVRPEMMINPDPLGEAVVLGLDVIVEAQVVETHEGRLQPKKSKKKF